MVAKKKTRTPKVRRLVNRPFEENGYCDRHGRLTAAGHTALMDYLTRYFNPVGLVKKIRPSVGYELMRLIREKRVCEDEFRHLVAADAADAIRYFRLGSASLDTFLSNRSQKVAADVIRHDRQRRRTSGPSAHENEDGEMAPEVAVALATAGDGQSESDEADRLRWHLRHLDPRDREVITRVTINGELLRVVADDLGVCMERVRQIEGRALAVLRFALLRGQVADRNPNGSHGGRA